MSISVTISPTAALSLSSDRPITDAAWRAAQSIERAQLKKRSSRHGHVTVGRITMKPSTAVALMVHAIKECAFARGEVHRADFERLGLTATQIDTLRGQAYRRALIDEPRIAQCLAG